MDSFGNGALVDKPNGSGQICYQMRCPSMEESQCSILRSRVLS